MLIRFLILCSLVALASEARAQWTVLLDKSDFENNSYYYGDIDCSDDRNCTAIGFMQPYAGGYRFTAFRSDDGGATWKPQELPVHPRSLWPIARLQKVQMLDSLNALIVGDSGIIIRTTDAGATWQLQASQQQWSYNDGQMLDATTGYAVGNYSKLVKTTDGVNWSGITSPTKFVMSLVRPVASDRLFVFDRFYGMQFISTNGGTSWDSVTLFPDYYKGDTGKYILDAYFWDKDRGIIAGGNRQRTPAADRLFVMRTWDGGKSWEVTADTVIAPSLYANTIDFFDTLNGVVGGGTNSLARTSDGGRTWMRDSAQFDRGMSQFTGVQMLSEKRVIATAGAMHSGYLIEYIPGVLSAPREETPGVSLLKIESGRLRSNQAGTIRFIDLAGRVHAKLRVGPSGSIDLNEILGQSGRFVVHFTADASGQTEMLKLVWGD